MSGRADRSRGFNSCAGQWEEYPEQAQHVGDYRNGPNHRSDMSSRADYRSCGEGPNHRSDMSSRDVRSDPNQRGGRERNFPYDEAESRKYTVDGNRANSSRYATIDDSRSESTRFFDVPSSRSRSRHEHFSQEEREDALSRTLTSRREAFPPEIPNDWDAPSRLRSRGWLAVPEENEHQQDDVWSAVHKKHEEEYRKVSVANYGRLWYTVLEDEDWHVPPENHELAYIFIDGRNVGGAPEAHYTMNCGFLKKMLHFWIERGANPKKIKVWFPPGYRLPADTRSPEYFAWLVEKGFVYYNCPPQQKGRFGEVGDVEKQLQEDDEFYSCDEDGGNKRHFLHTPSRAPRRRDREADPNYDEIFLELKKRDAILVTNNKFKFLKRQSDRLFFDFHSICFEHDNKGHRKNDLGDDPIKLFKSGTNVWEWYQISKILFRPKGKTTQI